MTLVIQEMNRRRRALALVLTLLGAVALCPTGAIGADGGRPIKIGFISSLTGPGAIPGNEILKGVRLYLDEIKNKMAGRDVELVVEDSESSAAKIPAKFRKLIQQDQVDLLDGVFLSSEAYAVAPIANELHVPLVISTAGADDLTQRKRSDWVIRTSFSSSLACHPLGTYAAKVLHYKKIVTVASDYQYGHESVGGFQRTFEDGGGQIIQKLWVPLDAKDYAAIIKSIRKDADAVFFAISGWTAEHLPKQYKELGPGKPILGSLAAFDESVLPKAGEYLLGGISSHIYAVGLDTPSNQHFIEKFREKYGQNPGGFTETGYTSAMWINKAVQMLHGDVSDKQKLMSALRRVQLSDDPRGPIKLDEYGNPVENVYIRRVEKTKDGIVNAVIFKYPSISQFYKWNPQTYMAAPPYTRDYPPCTHCTTTP
jgi:branched-chain amino acid transport system substrate-binding protein